MSIECRTRPQYVEMSYCEAGSSRDPGMEEVMARCVGPSKSVISLLLLQDGWRSRIQVQAVIMVTYNRMSLTQKVKSMDLCPMLCPTKACAVF